MRWMIHVDHSVYRVVRKGEKKLNPFHGHGLKGVVVYCFNFKLCDLQQSIATLFEYYLLSVIFPTHPFWSCC